MAKKGSRTSLGWTLDTLFAHLTEMLDERDKRYEQRFLAQEKAVESALISAEKAVTKAETASEKRFESVNEFRATLQDQARDLMPRLETEQRLGVHATQIEDLKNDQTERSSRGAAFNASWGYLIAVIAAVGTIITIVVILL